MSERPTDMPRIGRRPRPGEGTMQLVRERPEVLEHMAMLMWSGVVGLGHTLEAVERWNAMPEQDRAAWVDRAFAQISEDAARYDAEHPEPPDDPGGGGEPHPIPVEKIA